SDGARLAFDIEQRNVAFGRGIKFDNSRDGEPGFEVAPDVRPQPVSAAQPEPMRRLARVRGRVDEIAAELADILKHRAVPALHVVPELTGRKSFPDRYRAAIDQHCADRCN